MHDLDVGAPLVGVHPKGRHEVCPYGATQSGVGVRSGQEASNVGGNSFFFGWLGCGVPVDENEAAAGGGAVGAQAVAAY